MIKVTTIQAIRAIGALLILLSGEAFAVTAYATQAGLNTEISNRKAADTAEVTNRNTAISTERIRATGAEGTLKAALVTETARAKAAEAAGLAGSEANAPAAKRPATNAARSLFIFNFLEITLFQKFPPIELEGLVRNGAQEALVDKLMQFN